MDILLHIESHLRVTQVSPSRFGRQSCNDPRLVFDLRNGRKIGGPLQARIRTFILSRTKSEQSISKKPFQ